MKNTIILLSAILLGLFLGIFEIYGQSAQTIFNIEESVNKSVAIPSDVIAILKSDQIVDVCFQEKGTTANETEWFEASEIDLNGDNRFDLVVKARDSCLLGANQGPFWIFQNRADGWLKIFSASGTELTILPRKSNSFSQIKLGKVISMNPFNKIFSFKKGKYR